jgi:hypothetical protein
MMHEMSPTPDQAHPPDDVPASNLSEADSEVFLDSAASVAPRQTTRRTASRRLNSRLRASEVSKTNVLPICMSHKYRKRMCVIEASKHKRDLCDLCDH